MIKLNHQPFNLPLSALIDNIKNACGITLFPYPYKIGMDSGVVIAGDYVRSHMLETHEDKMTFIIDSSLITTKKSYKELVDDFFKLPSPDYKFEGDGIVTQVDHTTGMITINFSALMNAVFQGNEPPTHTIVNGSEIITKHMYICPGQTTDLQIGLRFVFIFTNQKPVNYINDYFNCDINKIYYNGIKVTMMPDFINAFMSGYNIIKFKSTDDVKKIDQSMEYYKRKFPQFTHHKIVSLVGESSKC